MAQWLGLCTSTAEGPGSIPGQGTKKPQAACTAKDKTKQNKNNCSLFEGLQTRSHRGFGNSVEHRGRDSKKLLHVGDTNPSCCTLSSFLLLGRLLLTHQSLYIIPLPSTPSPLHTGSLSVWSKDLADLSLLGGLSKAELGF